MTCPQCKSPNACRRHGVHFDHEYRCGDCGFVWQPCEECGKPVKEDSFFCSDACRTARAIHRCEGVGRMSDKEYSDLLAGLRVGREEPNHILEQVNTILRSYGFEQSELDCDLADCLQRALEIENSKGREQAAKIAEELFVLGAWEGRGTYMDAGRKIADAIRGGGGWTNGS